MAVSDVWRAWETIKESLSLATVDVSYYLVLSGIVMMIFTVSFLAGLVIYKVLNNAANADTLGFIKSIVIISAAIFVIGLVLP